jgi:AcrR family transcriptional regulator
MSDTPPETPPRRRPYLQTARAARTTATRARILAAAADALRARPPEAVALDAVARDAGTTVPTVLRHFAGKDALVAAALADALARVRAARPRPRAPRGLQARAAADVLAAEYEEHATLLRAADTALPAGHPALEEPRRLHAEWIARTFAPALSPLLPAIHRRRLAQLVAVSSPAAYRILREDQHLGPAQARAALAELLQVLAP